VSRCAFSVPRLARPLAGAPDVNEAVLEIDVVPYQGRLLAAPEARIGGEADKQAGPFRARGGRNGGDSVLGYALRAVFLIRSPERRLDADGGAGGDQACPYREIEDLAERDVDVARRLWRAAVGDAAADRALDHRRSDFGETRRAQACPGFKGDGAEMPGVGPLVDELAAADFAGIDAGFLFHQEHIGRDAERPRPGRIDKPGAGPARNRDIVKVGLRRFPGTENLLRSLPPDAGVGDPSAVVRRSDLSHWRREHSTQNQISGKPFPRLAMPGASRWLSARLLRHAPAPAAHQGMH
jgi:hypothetical protein